MTTWTPNTTPPAGWTGSAPAISSGADIRTLVGNELIPAVSGGAQYTTTPAEISAYLAGQRYASGSIVPYQIGPQSVTNFYSYSYGSEVNSFSNVFSVGAVSQSTSTAPVVALFGEGVANSATASAWGGNHVGVATVSGATAIADEIDAVATAPGAIAYGVVISSAGSTQAQNAIQIQGNAAASKFINGINFNGNAGFGPSNSLITADPNNSANYAINIAGTYSVAELALPSFHVAATVSSINSGLAIQGSSSGNPTLAAIGVGGSPATNSNLNFAAIGTGSVQFLTGGSGGTVQASVTTSGLNVLSSLTAQSSTAIPAGGSAGKGLMVSSTANFGIFFGSGAPTLSAAQGSLYIRSDGSSTSTRLYVNTNGSTTWTNVTTAA